MPNLQRVVSPKAHPQLKHPGAIPEAQWGVSPAHNSNMQHLQRTPLQAYASSPKQS
ncbi:hypothetical protein GOP47_0031093, partial [Adiantum capillus-veneris]